MPVSCTEIHKLAVDLDWRMSWLSTLTWPRSVNLTALLIRLAHICLTRVGSPITTVPEVLPSSAVTATDFCLALISSTRTQLSISSLILNGIDSNAI